MKIISVKRKHIRNGKPSDPYFCPIALALNEQAGEEWSVGTTLARNRIDDFEVDLSGSVQRFINRFDQNMSVKPFRFKFDI